MLSETLIAAILLFCLTSFSLINLHNILRLHKRNDDSQSLALVKHPSGLIVTVAAFGTFIYFAEAMSYLLLAFSIIPYSLGAFPLSYQLPIAPHLQILGIVMTAGGYFIFDWSVMARGQYATSWSMRKSHKLVTWGPYRYVRHPSYLGYFLMFIGLPLIWSNMFALIPLVAIPGYYEVTLLEEEMLSKHFGKDYQEYRERTGRFIPKLTATKQSNGV